MPGEIRSLAVLPFENLSSDPDQGYFADGMTDALITSLAQIKSVRVISRTSVLSYKGVERPISTIARELSVDAIIEGSVLRAGDQVRITAQLIHAGTDRHLWAASYDGGLSDVLTLQNKVAHAIAGEVRASLSTPEEARLLERPKVDPSVLELYLRGRHLLTRRTEPELKRALEYFEQAAARDPQYALAHVGVAQVWDALASWPGYVQPITGYPKAKLAATRALALDDSLAEAHTTLASVRELFDWNVPAAEQGYRRAIALNPNYALAHHRYGQLLGRTGRPEAALEAGLRARALDPLSLETNVGLSFRLMGVGRPKEALAQMLVAVELDRNYFDSQIHLADLHQRQGSRAEAIAAAERGIQLSGRSAHAVHGLAVIYVREGELAKAKPLIAELETHPLRNSYDIATLYLQLGQNAMALRWLQRACDDRAPAMGFLKTAQAGRLFDGVRDDARFLRVLRCVEDTARRANEEEEDWLQER
jgi:TolB-like protein/Tfp pilus assembly protein PilF